MKQELDRVRELVSGYRKGADGNHLETIHGLLSAVEDCAGYVKDNARNDRGCAQRMARDLDALLSEFAPLRSALADPRLASKVHNRRLAEEHLQNLQEHLEGILKAEEDAKTKQMHDWVKHHPVFGKIKRKLGKSLPKTAYVLLFRQAADDTLQLVTQSAEDGRIFTRFKMHEFKNDFKLHRLFGAELPVVGAAIVAENELLHAIGNLPQPQEGSDQLKTVLALSSEAASRPAREFIELNAILKELHEMARQHKLGGKDLYVLIFESAQEAQQAAPALVVKTGDNGKIISRFWSADFAVRHKLFEHFRHRPPVVGAAVIKDKELIHVLGEIPPVPEGDEPAESLLSLSRSAVEKPFTDFLANNEVLDGLHKLANDGTHPAEAEVILFVESGGKTEVYTIIKGANRRVKPQIFLSDFRNAKLVHDRLADKAKVVGASVIGEEKEPAKTRTPVAAGQQAKDASKRHAQPRNTRMIVLAAFGRTPLKANLVASPENLRRWGIEL